MDRWTDKVGCRVRKHATTNDLFVSFSCHDLQYNDYSGGQKVIAKGDYDQPGTLKMREGDEITIMDSQEETNNFLFGHNSNNNTRGRFPAVNTHLFEDISETGDEDSPRPSHQ